MTNEGCQLSAVSYQLSADAGSFAVLEGAQFGIQTNCSDGRRKKTKVTSQKSKVE